MTYALDYTRRAEQDLIRLAQHIAQDSPTVAARLIDNTDRTIQDLQAFPESRALIALPGLSTPHLRRAVIHGFPNHLLVYSFNGHTVVIERAFHATQDWIRFLRDTSD